MENYQNQKTSKLGFAGRIILAVASLVGALDLAGCAPPLVQRDPTTGWCWKNDNGEVYSSPNCDGNWKYEGNQAFTKFMVDERGHVYNAGSSDQAQLITGGLLGMAAAGAGDIGQPNRDLALRGAASGLQNAQQNEAIRNSGQVNVNINNANQSTASDSSIRYLKDQKMTDGSTYMGQLKLMSDGLLHPHGQGVMTAPDGRRYEGEWKDGLPNGHGIETSSYGTNDVEYREGKRVNIKGVQIWPDGTQYEGEWNRDGKSSGKILWKDGREYTGEWKLVEGGQDLPDGEGAMKWSDGRNYSGDFRDGKMYGFGKMVYADGRTEEGVWRDDKFVGSQSQVSAGDNQSGQRNSSKFGFVNVAADDPTFEVFVDGAFVGNSPAKLKLSEGPHTIEVRKEGFKDYKKEIRVADGSELNLRAVLEKQ